MWLRKVPVEPVSESFALFVITHLLYTDRAQKVARIYNFILGTFD